MRQAFVLQLGAVTDTTQQHFVGILEELDTGRDCVFKSTGELLAFLAQCFERELKQEPQAESRCENELGVSLMLKLRVENLGQIAILHIAGHIVIGPEIELLRKSVSSQTDASAVVLNLKRVTRIDARGLGLLLELRGKLNQSGVKFRLMHVEGSIQQILRLTCLDSVFEISTEEEIRSGDSEELILVS